MNEWRLYKNFFSPAIKLVLKERVAGKIHRIYDRAKTPYQRLLESDTPEERKQELKAIYQSLNPAELKRVIDKKLDNLYKFYKQKNTKNNFEKVDFKKKISVRFQNPVSVR